MPRRWPDTSAIATDHTATRGDRGRAWLPERSVSAATFLDDASPSTPFGVHLWRGSPFHATSRTVRALFSHRFRSRPAHESHARRPHPRGHRVAFRTLRRAVSWAGQPADRCPAGEQVRGGGVAALAVSLDRGGISLARSACPGWPMTKSSREPVWPEVHAVSIGVICGMGQRSSTPSTSAARSSSWVR